MARLDTAHINGRPRFMLIDGYGMDNGIHIIRAKVRAEIGAIAKILMMMMGVMGLEQRV